MLSPRPSSDGGPLRQTSSVQGFTQLQLDCRPRFVAPAPVHVSTAGSPDAYLAQSPGASVSPALSSSSRPAPLRRSESSFSVDTVNPRIQSPLRHSFSSTDLDPLYPASHAPRDSRPARPESLDMSYTGDKKTRPPANGSGNRKSGWLSGSYNSHTPEAANSPNSPTRSPSSSITPKSAVSSSSSRFAFFASSMSALKELTAAPVSVSQDDELMYLDIDASLFPAGSPPDGSAFSPAAYKNLQMTATGLLNKFQIAYQQRSIEIRELRAEREAQREEQDEVETRVTHLKMQLEEMARKAAEREKAMEQLLHEIAQEKQMRLDLEERTAHDKMMAPSAPSITSEDLGAEEDQKKRIWRRSNTTSKSEETDEESVDEASIFSRSRSPTITTTVSEVSPSTIEAPPPPLLAPAPKPATLGPPRRPRPSAPQISTFQKLFKGISAESAKEDDASLSSCRNCQGQEASVAWDTVNLLKDENRGLKHRVEELETAVEGALDVANGLMI